MLNQRRPNNTKPKYFIFARHAKLFKLSLQSNKLITQ